MPSTSTSLATLRPLLASSLEEFNLAADRQGFIGARVLPIFDAAQASGTFGVIPIEQLLQNRETTRGPGGDYSRGSFTFTSASFATYEHGAEEPVDDNQAKLYRDYFDAEMVAASRAYDVVLRNAEKRAAALLFNPTTFAGQLTTVTNEWDKNHKTNATPMDDVETAIRAVWNRTGLWPTSLIVNRTVFRNMRNLDQIIERIQAAGAGNATKPSDITPAMLASVFDLDEVIVAGSPKNAANEGQSVSIASIWSDEYAMVARVARTGDIAEPCIGRTFHWSEDGSQPGGTVETYRDETVRSNIVRVRHQVGEKLIYIEAAQLLDNITT